MQPADPRRSVPVSYGSNLVIRESVCIKRQPISHPGQAIGQVKSRSSVSRIVGRTWQSIPQGENALDELVGRERDAFPRENRGSRKSKLDIWSRLETEGLLVQ